MILNSKYEKNIIYPGFILYKNAVDITDYDVDNLVQVYKDSFKFDDKYGTKIKNTLWHLFKIMDKEDEILYLQKIILKFIADYVDTFPEAVHTIQWQEKINIDIDVAGETEYILNPNQSYTKLNKKINNIPFSRQIFLEISIDDQYDGGEVEWLYLPDVNIKKMNKGDILIYPANYLFSRKQSSIISGRKMFLTTFFNGGKDFLYEDEDYDSPNNNLLSSYLL